MVGRYYAINVSTFQSNFTGDAVAIRKARRLANDCRKDSMRNDTTCSIHALSPFVSPQERAAATARMDTSNVKIL